MSELTRRIPERTVQRTLEGKRALVTGGSRGIGRGIALALAERGAAVAVGYYQNEAAARETLAGVEGHESEGLVVQADVARPEEVEGMLEAVRSRFGTLDIFVSNARPELPAFFQPPMDITLEQWDAAFDSQAKAFLVAVRTAATFMADDGRVIAITYGAGSRTGSLQPWAAMGSAKAALESMVRYFAVALARRGITVNAISPGWIEDSVLNSLPPEAQDLIRGWHQAGWTPMRRLGTPRDIGGIAALLSSPEAGWITGQVIFADGGSSLLNAEIPPEIQLGG
jgi:NAD(P)-dependent dehydrogenase (short-subunit alcohol dehydrogenase family)